MSDISDNRKLLLEKINQYRNENNIKVNIPHQCNPECKWLKQDDLYGCVMNKDIHECGLINRCKVLHIDYINNTYQCLKTGYVISFSLNEKDKLNSDHIVASDSIGMYINSSIHKESVEESFKQQKIFLKNRNTKSKPQRLATVVDSVTPTLSDKEKHNQKLKQIMNLNYLDHQIDTEIVNILSTNNNNNHQLNKILRDDIVPMDDETEIRNIVSSPKKRRILYDNDSNNNPDDLIYNINLYQNNNNDDEDTKMELSSSLSSINNYGLSVNTSKDILLHDNTPTYSVGNLFNEMSLASTPTILYHKRAVSENDKNNNNKNNKINNNNNKNNNKNGSGSFKNKKPKPIIIIPSPKMIEVTENEIYTNIQNVLCIIMPNGKEKLPIDKISKCCYNTWLEIYKLYHNTKNYNIQYHILIILQICKIGLREKRLIKYRSKRLKKYSNTQPLSAPTPTLKNHSNSNEDVVYQVIDIIPKISICQENVPSIENVSILLNKIEQNHISLTEYKHHLNIFENAREIIRQTPFDFYT